MSTMGIVYAGSAAEREQLMLLRTLQDNERNIIGNAASRLSPAIAPKAAVSVINVNASLLGENQEQRRPAQQQQQQQQQQQASSVLPPYDPSRLKKHGKNGQPPPIAVAKRNARERNRVKQVNNGFATLRQHIPSHVAQGYGDRGKKLSKVETLRMAVEYIRGLQRLLAEADGLDYDAVAASNQHNQQTDSSLMIPSPSGSVYSSGTHNGSSDILCMDEQQSATGDHMGLDEDADGESYLHDEEDDEDEARDRRDLKRFRPDDRGQNRLAENQNRNTIQRRRRNSPSGYYVGRPSSFGDEENIEPMISRNNNNTSTANNNNNNNNNSLLTSFSPILLQGSSPTSLGLLPIKREVRAMEDEESHRSPEEDAGVVLTSSSPYTGEILIENPETGRLVPLKLEDHDTPASAQLVYLATSAEGLPTAAYYKHEITASEGTTEFMDVVSWWEQEQGRLVHQLQDQHQQLAVAPQQRLTHV